MKTTYNNLIQTQELQETMTPAMAIGQLKEGNLRFVSEKMIQRDYKKQAEVAAKQQYPFAAVLGCIDSRVPPEIIFDQGIGDIFNVRIAGNFVNRDILGSLEFACKVAGAKAIIVLGHTHCGAVKGACDNVELGNLTEMLENLKPALQAVKGHYGESALNREQFVQKVAEVNVQLTIEVIKNQSEVLLEMCENNQIAIVGGMYNIKTGKVDFESLGVRV